jgi:hypothetical protein
MMYMVEMAPDVMVYSTKFYKDFLRNSDNIITSTISEAVLLVPLMIGIY